MSSNLHRIFVVCFVSFIVAAGPSVAGAQDAAPSTVEALPKIRVATKRFEPFVYAPAKEGGAFTGFSVELWDKIARELGVETEMYATETVTELMEQVHAGKADVAIAGITINSKREKLADFSHSFFESGLRIMIPGGREGSFTDLISSILSPALLKVFGFLLLLILVAAHFLWFFERRRNPEMFPTSYFRGIWEAIWWAAVTATTVGYGDRTPRGAAGRVVALVWMFSGIILISFFTATVTSALTVKQIEGTINSPSDLVGRLVGTAAGSTTVGFLEKQAIRVAEYKDIEEAYVALKRGEVEAVVYDWPNLVNYAKRQGRNEVQVVGDVFEPQSYGIAFPHGSPYQERVNQALLKLKENGVYQDLYNSWFSLDTD